MLTVAGMRGHVINPAVVVSERLLTFGYAEQGPLGGPVTITDAGRALLRDHGLILRPGGQQLLSCIRQDDL